MCGIWARLGSKQTPTDPMTSVKKLVARGPEGTKIVEVNKKLTLGFTRLAINGLTDAGMQPYQQGNLTWICNGEIYNSKAIEQSLGITATGSDCECIGDLYLRHRNDLKAFARALDGVFALVLYDGDLDVLVVARDPYGVRPLYSAADHQTLIFSSELKAILPEFKNVSTFLPGHVCVYDTLNLSLIEDLEYHSVPWITQPSTYEDSLCNIRFALEESVRKRLLTDRPVAALLSGGLDSSLIASLVQRSLRQLNKPPLKTFSIGFEGSSDVAHARIVADWIGSDHTEIIMTPTEFFEAIPSVIEAIESFDTTTVRASTGNYLIAKKIRELTDCKVVFNGDGSDELFGGYLYFNRAPSKEAFHAETARLLTDLHYFDVLRSDRSISANGLEARTPFLDKQFVSVVRSIDPTLLMPIPGKKVEKDILRQAFDDGITLPDEVLWRRKEAFSDGVSTPEKAWFQEIQDRVVRVVASDWKEKASILFSDHLVPTTPEEYYYRLLFSGIYGNSVARVATPYRWMPKWSPETTDPSARTLSTYTSN